MVLDFGKSVCTVVSLHKLMSPEQYWLLKKNRKTYAKQTVSQTSLVFISLFTLRNNFI